VRLTALTDVPEAFYSTLAAEEKNAPFLAIA